MIYIFISKKHRDREAEKVINSYQHTSLHATPEWLISLSERKTYRERPSKPNESACYSTQLTENMKKCSGLLQPASIIQIYVNLTKLAQATYHTKCKIFFFKKEKKINYFLHKENEAYFRIIEVNMTWFWVNCILYSFLPQFTMPLPYTMVPSDY